MTTFANTHVRNVVEAAKAAGFRVFVSENGEGTYGLYTDTEGTRIVTFNAYGIDCAVSGNYKTSAPSQTGNGWRIDDFVDLTRLQEYFDASAPRWAVGCAMWRYTTLAEHIATYGASSRYTEV